MGAAGLFLPVYLFFTLLVRAASFGSSRHVSVARVNKARLCGLTARTISVGHVPGAICSRCSHYALAASSAATPPVGELSPNMNQSSSYLSSLNEQHHDSNTKLHETATTAVVASKKMQSRPSFPVVLWRFTRPHTIIGSALAIPALHILAAPSYSEVFGLPTLISLIFAMVPSLLMNLYITGLNQITDVEIDKINKPDLPIAAGDLSPGVATIVVIAALALSLGMGISHPILGTQGLNVALWGSAILGTMYSLPPFRLKRFPLLAALCIVAVRGTIINAGFFAHAKAAAYGQQATSVITSLLTDRRCFLSSFFFGVFGIVIALMKDVPDVHGDRISNIRSFSVRIGQKTVFKTMRRLLSILFFTFGFGFVKASFTAPTRVISAFRAVTGVLAFAAGCSAEKKGRTVNAEDSGEVYQYYMHLWKLFYLSYLVLPFAR